MKINLFVIVSILAAVSVTVALTKSSRKNKNSELCRYRDGSSYRGSVSRSSNGRKCLRWRRIIHSWGASQGIADHNFCRNPDNSLMPWCFVRKRGEVRREFCDIPRCSSPAVRSTPKPTTTAPPFPVDTERTCGERSERRTNKIVGGSFTAIESQPWVSAIYYKRHMFLCGGSLISPCWVLTAAHCFFDEANTNPRHLSVYLGKTAINETDVSREQRFTVDKIIIHEEYNAANYNNDIALLKIRNTNGGCAEKTPSVRTVCLPPLHTKLPVGFTCTIAGFGMQTFNSAYSQHLKQADITLISVAACKRAPAYQRLMTENMFCAASPDWTADACKGDSGGPLVCEVSGRMFLFGVVSWGDGCASVNKPGVYTQVTNYNKWIAAKTGCRYYTKGLMYPPK